MSKTRYEEKDFFSKRLPRQVAKNQNIHSIIVNLADF